MNMPLHQSLRIGGYIFKQKLRRREKFPLIMELEPLFACNLQWGGCRKFERAEHDLKQRMVVEQAVGAGEECAAPMVCIAGGEALIHPEVEKMVNELVSRKNFMFLCTNAVLLRK